MHSWLSMWIKPRETIRNITTTNPKQHFVLLCAIYGFPGMLQVAQVLSLGEHVSLVGIILFALIFSTLFGFIGINITSALLFFGGKCLKGNAPFLHIRSAVAWSSVTNIAGILGWIVLMATFRSALFASTFVQMPLEGHKLNLFLSISWLQLGLGIWSFILLLKSLSEVQGFSIGRAFINVLIPIILVTLLIWFIA